MSLKILRMPAKFHFWGSLMIVIFASVVIYNQVTDRFGFANGELHQDVMDRWGAPITQPVPSVRYVESGAVFNHLNVLAFSKQNIHIDAQMNYRKRGLVYFSGFEFKFSGHYEVFNPENHDIDAVFVFPISSAKNEILLSNFEFYVNDVIKPVKLSKDGDKLIWTLRLSAAEVVNFNVSFSGRGLERFNYLLDPSLAVNDFKLAVNILGGDNYDYPDGVLPAHYVEQTENSILLQWDFPSLESGVPLGVILPSEKPFDHIISTMLRRAWVPFILMFAAIVLLCLFTNITLRIYESYLIASSYGFFFVLLAYLAAFMNFYAAYVLSVLVMGALMLAHLSSILGRNTLPILVGVLLLFLVIPTVAVIAQGYTGLIYTITILFGLGIVMVLTNHEKFRQLVELEKGAKL